MANPLDLDQLQTFVAIADSGSFTRAADEVHRTEWELPEGFDDVFAVDYVTDYIDPLDLGPFVLSAIGVAATIVTFRVLQRYLAARLPGRRVRKGECPFCGFPLRESGLQDGPHCAGCGRDVVAPCAACAAPRRVGSSYCGACGAS